jgi:hypothetical protein
LYLHPWKRSFSPQQESSPDAAQERYFNGRRYPDLAAAISGRAFVQLSDLDSFRQLMGKELA